MDAKYCLYIKKGDGSVIDSFAQWGIVCCKVPFHAGGKTKALAKYDWYDEHGEDTYIPTEMKFEAYDAEFELAYMGKELSVNPFNLSLSFQCINSFKRWLSGNIDNSPRPELTIYSPYSGIGRRGCYLLEISDEDPNVQLKEEAGNQYNENIVTFKLKIRVTDPMTNVVLTL